MKDWFAGERGAYFFLLLGIGLIALFGVLEYRFPKAEQLETARGRVLWQQETHGAMYFILSDKQQLVLYTKGDPDIRQRQTIRDAERYPVSVKFYRQQNRHRLCAGRFLYRLRGGGRRQRGGQPGSGTQRLSPRRPDRTGARHPRHPGRHMAGADAEVQSAPTSR